MTHLEQVTAWHTAKPEWTLTFSAREWDVLERAAQAWDDLEAPEPVSCTVPPEGWYCTRQRGHEGPCAAYPVDE